MQGTPPSAQQDALATAVLAQYGAAMLCVQSFEMALACLVSAVDLRRNLGSKANIERRLRRNEKRIKHLFHEASAAELRNLLSGSVDDELLEAIGSLVDWRNFLAHGYLTARLIGEQRTFAPEGSHVLELLELAKAFSAATERITAAIDSIVEAIGPREASEAALEAQMFREAVEGFVRTLVFAQPPEFKRP